MKKYYSRISTAFYLLNLFGIVAIFLGLCIHKFGGVSNIDTDYILLFLLCFTMFLVLSIVIKTPKKVQLSYKATFYKLLSTYIPFSAFVFAMSFLLKDKAYSRRFVLLFLFIYLMYLFLIYLLFDILNRKGRLYKDPSNIIIIGAGSLGKKLFTTISEKFSHAVKVAGFLDDNKEKCESLKQYIIGKISDYSSILKNNQVDEVYITIPMSNENKIKEIIELSEYHGVKVRIIPNYFRLSNVNFSSYYFDDIPIINVREIPLEYPLNRGFKRSFDLVASFFVLIITSPVFLIVSLLIKLTSKGPVFFVPTRIGLNRKQFKMYKFRSMYITPPEISHTQSTVENDCRITPVGKFIRKWNIDELPQFINVLKGDMSVIGPRPHRVNLDEELINEVYNYRIRQCVKPGITGWAQVNGYRGPTDTIDKKNGRIDHDLYYIENWSPWLDIKIVLLTIFSRKARKNAF